jgi:MFS transporter, AAHS family, 4-hydroxybenzoate transporter
MTKTIDLFDYDKMSNTQLITILLCFLMNTLDGMDVMVVSYAAPAIAKEWAFTMQTLGVVFSAGLIGMTVGTIVIAPRADIVGRRAIILLCAVIMGITVFATYLAQSIEALIFFRFISGIGIGGMLASSATLTSEYAPRKTKDFWVSFVMSGYPVGAVLSGLAAAQIIPAYGWRAMFQTAGIVTLLTLPLIYYFLSESLDFLVKKRPANALQKINAILNKMNQPALFELPTLQQSVESTSLLASKDQLTIGERFQIFIQMIKDALLTPERKLPTLWLWTALFMSFGSMYYLLTWIPKLAASTGLFHRISDLCRNRF